MLFRTSSRRQKMFHEALARETKKTKKRTDRSEDFRTRVPYGVGILWLIFFGVGGYSIVFSSLLFVTQINVRDAQSLQEDEIRTAVDSVLNTKRWFVFPARNLFLVPTTEIEKRLRALSPLIDHVIVHRVFPDRIQVSLVERPELLLWCAGGPCVLLNEQGEAWSHEKMFDTRYGANRYSIIDTSALPTELGQELPVQEYLNYFSRFVHEAVNQIAVGIEREATTPSRYSRELRLTTTEGWTILVNIDNPLDETLLSLQSFLLAEQKKQHPRASFSGIDARVPGRLFITNEPLNTITEIERSQVAE